MLGGHILVAHLGGQLLGALIAARGFLDSWRGGRATAGRQPVNEALRLRAWMAGWVDADRSAAVRRCRVCCSSADSRWAGRISGLPAALVACNAVVSAA